MLDSATYPNLAGDESEQLRERLRAAGFLVESEPYEGPVPSARRLARARKAAGRGTPLSDLVSQDRGLQ